MVIFKKINAIKDYILELRKLGKRIGFIPTMGALHAGHISLIEKANKDGFVSICSIFLNPTQFNNRTDFEKYPKSTDNDIELLIYSNCEVLFLPDENEIYPNGTTLNTELYDFGYLETILEGEKRKNHYKGVAQVVSRLFEIVKPDCVFLGQKDYQQCLIITSLIKMMNIEPDSSFDYKNIEIIICPTVREADGLAMSSRNRRLTDAQRSAASIIYQCLVSIEAKQGTGEFEIVKKECEDILIEKGFVPDYVAIADSRNLQLLDKYDYNIPTIALIAAKIGEIRLIDNLMI